MGCFFNSPFPSGLRAQGTSQMIHTQFLISPQRHPVRSVCLTHFTDEKRLREARSLAQSSTAKTWWLQEEKLLLPLTGVSADAFLLPFNPSFPVSILWFPGSSDEKKLSPHLRQPTLYSPRKHTHTPKHSTHPAYAHTPNTHMHMHTPTPTHMHIHIHHVHTCICAHTYTPRAYAHTTHMQPLPSRTGLALSIGASSCRVKLGPPTPCAHGRDPEDNTQLDCVLFGKKMCSGGGPPP